MRIAVHGLWHLGCVTAGGAAAAGHRVVGLDPDPRVVDALGDGRAPIFEPGLNEQIGAGLRAGLLSFTTHPEIALAEADALWITFDTSVDERDDADLTLLRARLEAAAPALHADTLVIVSSQVSVGFARMLADDWRPRGAIVASLPENLRLGRALECFARPDRVVVGLGRDEDRARVAPLLASFGWPVEWMTLESAEMTKHALNAFLATTVTFVNELARLCESVGADIKEVERGLKSDARVGARPYLSPGGPFAGGTLARDLRFLSSLGESHATPMPLCDGVLASNALHEGWGRGQLERRLRGVERPVVAVLGLVYKPGTNTLRRSSALELCQWLTARGVTVRAHDPAVPHDALGLPAGVQVLATAREALQGADAAVLATAWPEYSALSASDFVRSMRRPCLIDQTWALAALAEQHGLVYVAPGQRRAGA